MSLGLGKRNHVDVDMLEIPSPDTAMVSGTRIGMTNEQKRIFALLLESIRCSLKIFRHGDCIGADMNAHEIVQSLFGDSVRVHIHPPLDNKERAFCEKDSAVVHQPEAYLKRDKTMVNSSDIVFAFPKGANEQKRGSGTWAVIRHARKKGKPLVVVYPDGSVGK